MYRDNRNELPAAKCSGNINYSILAPKFIRANSNFTFSVTIYDERSKFDEAVVVQVSIKDEHDEARFKIHRYVAMNPNITEMVSIPVGNVPTDRKYKLVVNGISGTNMKHEAQLHLQTQTHIILIQTNKAIYKPNDCIKFRALVLDLELKAAPIENNELKIDITVSRFFFDFNTCFDQICL